MIAEEKRLKMKRIQAPSTTKTRATNARKEESSSAVTPVPDPTISPAQKKRPFLRETGSVLSAGGLDYNN